jgi:3',5'-cyclic AMP phosphodiesterase CpdA
VTSSRHSPNALREVAYEGAVSSSKAALARARVRVAFAILGVLVSASSMSVAAAPERPALEVARNEFTFVVLGDSQLDAPETFNRLIDDAAMLRPAFVVQVGDLIDGYTDDKEAVRAQWARFRAQIRPLGDIPFFPVPGNHDLYGANREWSRMLDEVYRELWGDPYYAFTYGNARFIILNTDEKNAAETIGGEQWGWLEHELTVTSASNIFVFMHRPPRTLENAEALHQLFTRFPVAIVFFGHLHHYEYHVRDGIRYVMTNATGEMGTGYVEAGSIPHLIQVHVRDDEVSFAVIPANTLLPPDFAAPDDNAALYGLRRTLLAPDTVETRELTQEDDGWSVRLLLSNPTPQTMHAYLEWSSPDGRWAIGPEPAVRVTLPPHAESKAVPFTLARPDGSRPEGWPSCEIRAPYLTSTGKWVTVTRTFRITERRETED